MKPFLPDLLLMCNDEHRVRNWIDQKHQPEYLAIDCEMVETSVEHRCLAHIVITKENQVLLDELVKPRGIVKDYLTFVSGLTKEILDSATLTHSEIQKKVLEFVTPASIFVGHDCGHDFRALGFEQKQHLVLDSAVVFRYIGFPSYIPSLTDLSYIFLGMTVHEDGQSHSPQIDALAAWHLIEFALDRGPQRIRPPRFVLDRWGMKPQGSVYLLREVPPKATWIDIERACVPFGTVAHIQFRREAKTADVEFESIIQPRAFSIQLEDQLVEAMLISKPARKRMSEAGGLISAKRRKIEEDVIANEKVFACDLDFDREANFDIGSSDDDSE